MKKFYVIKRYLEKFNYEQEDYSNVIIKKDRRKVWMKNTVKLFCIIFISSMLGTFLSVYLITSKYFSKIVPPTTNNTNIVTEYKNSISSVIQQIAPTIVTIGKSESELSNEFNIGNNVSGVIIRSDGYILTSYNSIKDFDNIYVNLSSVGTRPFKAEIIGEDNLSDLAIIKINVDGLPKAKFGNEDSIEVGDKVIAIGNAISDEYIGMVTSGIITSLNKKIRLSEGEKTEGYIYNVIETDTIINAENNSGVLCNLEGEIIGINSLYLSEKFSQNSLNYALNINDVKRIIDSILSYKDSGSVSLGIEGATLIGDGENSISGVYVESLIEGGVAESAGIRPTDIIIELDNKEINKLEDIVDIISQHGLGDTIKCKVLRGNITTEIFITLK